MKAGLNVGATFRLRETLRRTTVALAQVVRWPIIIVALALASNALVIAQSPTYRAARTPDGQPDLQGF